MGKIHIIIVIFVLALFTGCGDKTESTMGIGRVGEHSPVTRAETARMLALAKYSEEEIKNMERTVPFTDTDSSQWYDKYINAAYTGGLVSGADETHFNPEDYLTLRQAQFLITKLSGSQDLQLKYAEEDRNKPVSYSMWNEAFLKAAQRGGYAVEEKDIVITGDNTVNRDLGGTYWLTDIGIMSCEGIRDKYTNSLIRVIKKDNSVLGVEEVVSLQPRISGLSVLKKDKKGVSLKIPGGERYFYYDGDDIQEGTMISITFEENKILAAEKVN